MMNLVDWTLQYDLNIQITIFCQGICRIVPFATRSWYYMVQLVPREWIDSRASIHSFIIGGKGKTYVLAKTVNS